MNNADAEKMFHAFISDEGSAIDQLKTLVGGELRPRLDSSLPSLRLLDRFVRNLTNDSEWTESSLFGMFTDAPERWLAARIAYYFASCLRNELGGEWRLCDDEESPYYRTPIWCIRDLELSPLHIATEFLAGRTDGGMANVAEDLVAELL